MSGPVDWRDMDHARFSSLMREMRPRVGWWDRHVTIPARIGLSWLADRVGL